MITVKSTINLANQSVPNVIPVVQGDTGRSILFSLADFTIPTGATARYFVMKPSGLSVYNDATIEENTVLVDLTAQSLAEYGDCPGQVRIMLGQTVVTSFEFILHVEPFRGIDAVESSTETNIFDKAVEDAREAIAEAAEEAEEYISQALDTTLTIPDKAADAKATGDAISDSADAVIAQMRAEIADVYPTETAQGNPATFDDGADEIPVKDLKVSIVPNQDLHGYDKPWAGGAGKNKFDEVYTDISATSIHYRAIYVGDGTFTMSTECPRNPLQGANLFFLAGNVQSGASTTGNGVWESIPRTVTSSSGYVTVAYRSEGDVDPSNYHTQIESGSTVTSWVPYSNLCPITGMTEVEVERTGKNLLPKPDSGRVHNGVTWTLNNDGTVTANGTASGDSLFSYILPTESSDGNYYFLGCANGGTNSTYNVYMWDSTTGARPKMWDGTTNSPNSTNLTTRQEVKVVSGHTISLNCRVISGYTASNLTFKPMLIASTETDTSYAPYVTPQTVTTDLGRTVYGGTLDVTTGVLTVDRVGYVFTDGTNLTEGSDGDANWLCVKHTVTNGLFDTVKREQNICSYAPFTFANVNGTCHFYTTGNVFQLFVPKSTYPTLSAFTASLATSPLIYVAFLATPQTYTLTPQELLSVLGTNHISTDAESVEVVYRADIALYIENLTEPDADMIADTNITSGSYFMVGNTLYLATANIANGAAVVVGTNCVRSNLASALNAINA